MSDATRPPPREPVFNLPGVVIACCVVLLGLYAAFSLASDETKDWAIAELAFVPARAAIALDFARGALRASVQTIPQDTFTALIGSGGGRWWTVLTYALLHGSWAHVGFNCLWLVVFGAPVARRFGAPRFLLLMLVAAVAGVVAQFLWDPASFMPVIGASAAVSGAMGAAVRFIFHASGDRAESLDRRWLETAYRQPALSLAETFTNRGALAFIVLWFGTNLLFGLYPGLSGIAEGPIAWQAHVGGFLSGLFLFPLLDPRRPAPEREISADLPIGDDPVEEPARPA